MAHLYIGIFGSKTDRSNTDIGYSANLLKSMHNFAKEKHNLPSVNFQHSKNGRRVRAELISPQAYQAIIKQILGSVDILDGSYWV